MKGPRRGGKALGLAVMLAATASGAVQPTGFPGPDVPMDAKRPPSLPGFTRAWDTPLCVHAADGTRAETITEAERTASRVLHILQGEFHYPAPEPDGMRGGGPELDVYLVPPDDPALPGEAVADGLAYGDSAWDQSPAFVRVRNDLRGPALELAVAEGVSQAVLYGLNARQIRPLRLAMAHVMAARALGVQLDPIARDAFVRDSYRAIFPGRDDLSARGAAWFLEYLTSQYQDEHDPLKLMRGLAWLPIGRTWPSSANLNDDPDAFGGLWLLSYIDYKLTGGFDKVLTDFAVVRALADTPAMHDELRGFVVGRDVAPTVTARAEFRALPIVVTPPMLMRDTGSAFVEIDTRAAGDASLNVWFHGAPWREWRVTAVRLDAQGRNLGRTPDSPVVDGEWGTSLAFFKDCARVMIVIVDLGDKHHDLDTLPADGDFFTIHIDKG